MSPLLAFAALLLVNPPQVSLSVAAAAPAGEDSAAYAAITAPPGDRLVAVECGCAERIELHRIVRSPSGNSMARDPSWGIPDDGRLEIRPGSDLHVMLMGLRAPLVAGSAVELTLRFERGGAVVVRVPIVEDTRGYWQAQAR